MIGVTNEALMRNFVETNVTIDPTFKYGNVPRGFTRKAGVLKDEEKLVVPDEDVLKRLIYTLRLRLQTRREDTLNYDQRRYIENYFTDVSDFTPYDGQVILYGDEAVHEWIKSLIPSYIIRKELKLVPEKESMEKKRRKRRKVLDEKEEEPKEIKEAKIRELLIRSHLLIVPYFISNIILFEASGKRFKTFLVQPCRKIENALYICDRWYKNGYNIGPTDLLTQHLPIFYICDYLSSSEVAIHQVKGEVVKIVNQIESGFPIVCRYKKENETYWQAILPVTT